MSLSIPEFHKVTETHILGFRGDYKFLSNMWIDDQGFCVENHYQAAKVKEEFPTERQKILSATPHKSKSLGRRIPQHMRVPALDRERIMRLLLVLKFSNKSTASLLMTTGDRYLEETNDWHDNFWGNCVCLTLKQPSFGVKQSCKFPGLNKLGSFIMDRRFLMRPYA